MLTKQVERCFTHVIREMKAEIMRYHKALLGRPNLTLTTPSAGEKAGTRNSHSLQVGMQNGAAVLEGSLTVSYKTKHPSPYNPPVMLLGIYSDEVQT